MFYYLSSCVVSVVDADFFKKDDDDNNDDEDDDDAVVDLSMPESSFNRLRWVSLTLRSSSICVCNVGVIWSDPTLNNCPRDNDDEGDVLDEEEYSYGCNTK